MKLSDLTKEQRSTFIGVVVIALLLIISILTNVYQKGKLNKAEEEVNKHIIQERTVRELNIIRINKLNKEVYVRDSTIKAIRKENKELVNSITDIKTIYNEKINTVDSLPIDSVIILLSNYFRNGKH